MKDGRTVKIKNVNKIYKNKKNIGIVLIMFSIHYWSREKRAKG